MPDGTRKKLNFWPMQRVNRQEAGTEIRGLMPERLVFNRRGEPSFWRGRVFPYLYLYFFNSN